MPGERGPVCVICDAAAAAAELAIPHRPCVHVSMISLAVSDFDVKGRDRGRDHPVSEGFSRTNKSMRDRPHCTSICLGTRPQAIRTEQATCLSITKFSERASMTVIQAACIPLLHNLGRVIVPKRCPHARQNRLSLSAPFGHAWRRRCLHVCTPARIRWRVAGRTDACPTAALSLVCA